MRDIVLKGHHLSQQLAGCHWGLGSWAPQLSLKMTIFTTKFQGSYEFMSMRGKRRQEEGKGSFKISFYLLPWRQAFIHIHLWDEVEIFQKQLINTTVTKYLCYSSIMGYTMNMFCPLLQQTTHIFSPYSLNGSHLLTVQVVFSHESGKTDSTTGPREITKTVNEARNMT